jgi:hypothetical protein
MIIVTFIFYDKISRETSYVVRTSIGFSGTFSESLQAKILVFFLKIREK